MDITLTLTEDQYKALECVAPDVQVWLQEFAEQRVEKFYKNKIPELVNRYMDEGVNIPQSKPEMVTDAISRGWLKTIAKIEEERAALYDSNV